MTLAFHGPRSRNQKRERSPKRSPERGRSGAGGGARGRRDGDEDDNTPKKSSFARSPSSEGTPFSAVQRAARLAAMRAAAQAELAERVAHDERERERKKKRRRRLDE